MSIGNSGRIVIEVEPELKQKLHELLRQNGSNMKEWFTDHAIDYLDSQKTPVKRKTGRDLRVRKS